ncbi:MAG: toxin-antitoxin system PIN family toxin component [Algoriphagus marincola HL-49]|uniref:Toxin-antitoxin system PIN family toxin component n=1 Tax=Algoriphagus marincola HL-49 TaxID=1305737 RepID=A0A0P7YGX0_9BACT|nr:MAG: toxin-antitoxin system PIN family toxin component [Algoriphagus marincola HL-49]
MEFIDANYILRYLLRDNANQYLKAKDIIENKPIFVPEFIFAEVVYVLEKVYAVSRLEIQTNLESLIKYPNIELNQKNVCIEALQIYSTHRIDFADALLIAYYKTMRHSKLHTFDKKILKIISAGI